MKIPLHQGSYQARSPIANAQSCFNLVPEQNPQDAPFPVTHYPAPGLTIMRDYSGSYGGYVRGIYNTSNNNLIVCVGQNIINLTNGDAMMGVLGTDSGHPVSMCDNGTTLVIVDGSTGGGMAPLNNLGPNSLVGIEDPAFYGANRVDYIDTFLIFNNPGTGTFYTTTSGVVEPFDPTYAAAKEGWNDILMSIAALHDNIWLLGAQTTEVWYNAGGTSFPFARMPNSILQQGCVAPYSVVITDNAIYWLSADRWGRNMMMRGEGYMAKRISTFAVEDIWARYPTLTDAVGMSYQIGGHETVGIYFPTANAWWAYDASTQLWHQRTYGGTTNAWLPYCMAFSAPLDPFSAGGGIVAGDRTTGKLYFVNRADYTDNGVAIVRQRSWTHVQQDGNRLAHTRFSANMTGAALQPDTVNLSWSDDAGQTYGTPVPQTVNNATNGQYQWRRLGYARDRVYQLQWQGYGECALNGAYIDIIPQGT